MNPRLRWSSSIVASIAAVVLSLPCRTSADTLIDTGTPVGFDTWVLSPDQSLAAQFSIANPVTITSVEGWILPAWGGTLGIGIALDSSGLPGANLFRSTTELDEAWDSSWLGVSSLGWGLSPGTYWVTFDYSLDFGGGMQSGAPQPLGTYAWSYLDPVSNLPAWSTLTDDGPMDFGVRIAGVPDGGMTVAMLGLAMSGLVWLRRRLGVC